MGDPAGFGMGMGPMMAGTTPPQHMPLLPPAAGYLGFPDARPFGALLAEPPAPFAPDPPVSTVVGGGRKPAVPAPIGSSRPTAAPPAVGLGSADEWPPLSSGDPGASVPSHPPPDPLAAPSPPMQSAAPPPPPADSDFTIPWTASDGIWGTPAQQPSSQSAWPTQF